MQQGQNYKLAFMRSKKDLCFCLEQLPNLPPFCYTFEFDFFSQIALWAHPTSTPDQLSLTLTLQSPSQLKFLLDNQLLLALLILSSKLLIKRKQQPLKHEIEHIFKAMGVKLKWCREGDVLVAYLERVLVSNGDLMGLQGMYGKQEINIETVSTVKQFNAYNHIRELAEGMLEVVLAGRDPTGKYDEMIEELRVRYIQLSAVRRIRTVHKKWSFEKLQAEIHAKLVESLQRPVITVESERGDTETNNDICDLFQIRFSQIDEKIARMDFQVADFKEAINVFVKDVATDLRSQENLIILMEFLLAKTFGFFEMKEVLASANQSEMEEQHRQREEISMDNLIEKENDMFLRNKVIEMKKKTREIQTKYRNQVQRLEEKIWQIERDSMNDRVRLEKFLEEKQKQIKKTNDKIKSLEDQIKSLNLASQEKQFQHTKVVNDLSSQLQKLKIHSSITTPQDRQKQALITSTKSATVNRSPPAIKSNFGSTFKRPLESRYAVSMKQLPGPIDIKQISLTPQTTTAADSKPKTFSKKQPLSSTTQQQTLFKSPKASNDLLKKGQPKKSHESATLISNINAVVSYVKEQAKNISQRPVPIKGKENATTTTGASRK